MSRCTIRDVPAAVAHPLARNRPRHHVARRQLKQGMIPLHESLAAIVAQVRPFAAQRFRQQEPRHTRQRQCRGMELVELHVRQHSAGLKRKRNAVAGGHSGVGRVGVDLPRTAGRDQH